MTCFDIETAPCDTAAQYIPEQFAPANYKDEAKIAAYIAEAKVNALAKAALDPGLLRIVAIGYQHEDDEPVAMLARDEAEERAILQAWWNLVTAEFTAGQELLGYNVLGFDLPALITRSWLLGIRPAMSTLRRYNQHGIIDLMDRLSFGGLAPTRSLAWWCARAGIVSDDTTTGKEIPALVASEQWDLVEAHVLADIKKTAALAAWMHITKF